MPNVLVGSPSVRQRPLVGTPKELQNISEDVSTRTVGAASRPASKAAFVNMLLLFGVIAMLFVAFNQDGSSSIVSGPGSANIRKLASSSDDQTLISEGPLDTSYKAESSDTVDTSDTVDSSKSNNDDGSDKSGTGTDNGKGNDNTNNGNGNSGTGTDNGNGNDNTNNGNGNEKSTTTPAPTTATPTTENGKSCTWRASKGKDFEGKDLAKWGAEDFPKGDKNWSDERIIAKCTELVDSGVYPGATGFSFVGNNCFFKNTNGDGKRISKGGVSLYECSTSDPVVRDNSKCKSVTHEDSDYTGGSGDLTSLSYDSDDEDDVVDKCSKACLSEDYPDCTGFAKAGKSCWLKDTSSGGRFKKAGGVKFYELCPPPTVSTPSPSIPTTREIVRTDCNWNYDKDSDFVGGSDLGRFGGDDMDGDWTTSTLLAKCRHLCNDDTYPHCTGFAFSGNTCYFKDTSSKGQRQKSNGVIFHECSDRTPSPPRDPSACPLQKKANIDITNVPGDLASLSFEDKDMSDEDVVAKCFDACLSEDYPSCNAFAKVGKTCWLKETTTEGRYKKATGVTLYEWCPPDVTPIPDGPPRNCSHWSTVTGQDFFGGAGDLDTTDPAVDDKDKSENDFEECKKLCLSPSNPTCTGFAYNKGGKRCYMKNTNSNGAWGVKSTTIFYTCDDLSPFPSFSTTPKPHGGEDTDSDSDNEGDKVTTTPTPVTKSSTTGSTSSGKNTKDTSDNGDNGDNGENGDNGDNEDKGNSRLRRR